MRIKRLIVSLIILLLILILICVILLNYYKNNNQNSNKLEYSKEDVEILTNSVNNYLSDKIVPQGMSKLYSKYNGENDLNDLYRKIYTIINYLPLICENVDMSSDDEIEYFFDNNEKDIQENIGIIEKNEFIKLINYINKKKYNGEKFYTCSIDTSTFQENEKYFSFTLDIEFENFDNDFKLNTYFAIKESIEPKVYFSANEYNEEENIEE